MTFEEIKKLTEYQIEIFKDVFVTKDEFGEMKLSFNRLQNTVDRILKETLTIRQEMASMNHRLTKTENWIDKAAPKVGVPFEH
jgi:deoxyhypusine synthase